jgi:hypothetical protein
LNTKLKSPPGMHGPHKPDKRLVWKVSTFTTSDEYSALHGRKRSPTPSGVLEKAGSHALQSLGMCAE